MRCVVVLCGRVILMPRNGGAAAGDEGDLVGQPDGALGEDVQLVADFGALPAARLGSARAFGQDSGLDVGDLGRRPAVWKLGPRAVRGRTPRRSRSAFKVDDMPANPSDPLSELVGVRVREVVGDGAAGKGAR